MSERHFAIPQKDQEEDHPLDLQNKIDPAWFQQQTGSRNLEDPIQNVKNNRVLIIALGVMLVSLIAYCVFKSKIIPVFQGGTNRGNIPKSKYMNSQLQQISKPRKQKGGTRIISSGTVRQFEYLTLNIQNKSIDQVLYSDQQQAKRRLFNQERINFLSQYKNMESVYLATFNNKIDHTRDNQQKFEQQKQFERVNHVWQFDKYPDELQFCLIVSGYNNNANFRIQYNLNSIFQQNYSNYFVVIINDASTDNSDYVYRNYLNFYNIDKSIYIYIENNRRKAALENAYEAIHHYCSSDSISMIVDADDELIGKNVLKIFNVAYQKYKAGVIYSNFVNYHQNIGVSLGFTEQYTPLEKKEGSFRMLETKYSHLRSFRSDLFRQIDPKNGFIDEKGQFWKSACDIAAMLPLLELSCGRIQKISGTHYLYNNNTGNNHHLFSLTKQFDIFMTLRKMPSYNCSLSFLQSVQKS